MEEKDNTEQKTTETVAAEQGAQAQRENGSAAAGAFGKFESADALWKAYNSLQAEFTRRSQRLKELEKAAEENNAQRANEVPTPEASASAPAATPEATPEDEEDLFVKANASEKVRRRIVGEYLSEVKRGAVPLMKSGEGLRCPPERPKNLEDAGKMALGYFKNARQ